MNVFSATERKETAENINVESLAKILILGRDGCGRSLGA